jgi:predicted ATPase
MSHLNFLKMEELKSNVANSFEGQWISWETPFDQAVELINSAEIAKSLPLIILTGPKGAGKSTLISALCRQTELLGIDGDVVRIFSAARFWTLASKYAHNEHENGSSSIEWDLDAISMPEWADLSQVNDLIALIGGGPTTLGDVLRYFMTEGKSLWSWDVNPKEYEETVLKVLMRVHVVSGVPMSHEGMSRLSAHRLINIGVMVPSYRQYVFALKHRAETEFEPPGTNSTPLSFSEWLDNINQIHTSLFIPTLLTKVFATLALFIAKEDEAPEMEPHTFTQQFSDESLSSEFHILPHDYSPGSMRALCNFVVAKVFFRKSSEKEEIS